MIETRSEIVSILGAKSAERFFDVFALTPMRANARNAAAARTVDLALMLIVWFFAIIGAGPGIAAQIAAGGGDSRGTGEAQWKEFASRSGNFSVLFPGIPQASRANTKAPAGAVASNRFTVSAVPGVIYDVMYNDFPGSRLAVLNPEIALDAARDGLVHRTNGRVTRERTLSLEGGAAREVEIRGADATLYTARLLLVGGRLYQVLVIDRKSETASTRKFLDSFRLLRPTGAQP